MDFGQSCNVSDFTSIFPSPGFVCSFWQNSFAFVYCLTVVLISHSLLTIVYKLFQWSKGFLTAHFLLVRSLFFKKLSGYLLVKARISRPNGFMSLVLIWISGPS